MNTDKIAIKIHEIFILRDTLIHLSNWLKKNDFANKSELQIFSNQLTSCSNNSFIKKAKLSLADLKEINTNASDCIAEQEQKARKYILEEVITWVQKKRNRLPIGEWMNFYYPDNDLIRYRLHIYKSNGEYVICIKSAEYKDGDFVEPRFENYLEHKI